MPIRSAEAISVWLTTPDQANLLTRQPDISLSRNGSASQDTITIDESQSYQQMVGFGASFTDSSAWLVQKKLTTTQRTELMNKLFHPVAGIGLSFLRQPLGASDFTVSGNYSYDALHRAIFRALRQPQPRSSHHARVLRVVRLPRYCSVI